MTSGILSTLPGNFWTFMKWLHGDVAGKMVFYLDSGVFMCRWPIDWIYIAKG
jgi:hypothetical protein